MAPPAVPAPPAWVAPFLSAKGDGTEYPQFLLVAQVIYLLPCLTAWARPSLFPKRGPSAVLTLVMQAHNLLLIGWSLAMLIGCVQAAIKNGYGFYGNTYVPGKHADSAYWLYHFYISKVYEYMDTFLILAKGNLQQLSFLHVYHHLSVSAITWYNVQVAPGGDSWFMMMLNTAVHTLMYTYYFLATIITDPASRKKYLGWGRYLTQFQMTQFFLILTQHVLVIVVKGAGAGAQQLLISKLNVAYMVTLLALFGHFFLQRWGGAGKGGAKTAPAPARRSKRD